MHKSGLILTSSFLCYMLNTTTETNVQIDLILTSRLLCHSDNVQNINLRYFYVQMQVQSTGQLRDCHRDNVQNINLRYFYVGPEYGTTQGMWRGLLEEASSTADLHTNVAENLLSKVYQGIKSWQKENYHKSMMHFKETKEFEDGFKKVCKNNGLNFDITVDAFKRWKN